MAKKINIPLLDLKREYLFLKKEIDKQIKECLGAQHWILGEKVVELEKATAKYLGVKFAIGVASGTDALILSLRAIALKLKGKEYFDKKDEIITTPFTFVATAEAITRCGATPVFVDIDPCTFNINPREIKKAITENTVGIIPVHLFGRTCAMAEIMQIAKENNLFVVEDVAQAFGAECFLATPPTSEVPRKLGTIGDCGAFSFFPSKNLGGYGDGGLVATNDDKIADLIRVLRTHGQTKQYEASFIGYNSRLDTIQAAILLAKLKYIDKFNATRINIAQKYNSILRNIKDIQLPTVDYRERGRAEPPRRGLSTVDYTHVYNLYTIKVPAYLRDELLKRLNSCGIQARVYYPLPLHQMPAFKETKISVQLKESEEATQAVISLPLCPFLKKAEIQYIASQLTAFLKH
jgi:dTDP-4-amino-4,6-dideoxygalactose transaminase